MSRKRLGTTVLGDANSTSNQRNTVCQITELFWLTKISHSNLEYYLKIGLPVHVSMLRPEGHHNSTV